MLVAVIMVIVAYLIGGRVWAWFRLRHIAGPRWAGFTDLWMLKRISKGTLYEDLGDVVKEYGPLVRIGPNHLICGDPAEVRRMWSVRSQFDRAPWYKGFQLDPPNDCTLSMRDNDIHTALRAKLATGYSGKGIEGLHESVDFQIAKFIKLLETKYISTDTDFRPVDFARKAQFLTLDVISTVAFGRTFGFLDKDADQFGYIKTTEDTLPLMQWIAMVPWLINVLQSPLFKAFAPSDKDTIGLGKVMGIAKEVVAERYGEGKIHKPDMLGSFVANGLGQKEAESESLVQIVAGSDTTATALRMTMLHIATSPQVYRKLLAEIDQGIDEGRISSPITDAEARKLPFLQACIKEGFRIWPPITGMMPRMSNEDGVVCGVTIPKGTNVGWSARAVLRDVNTFGDDSNLYWPERWLNAEPEQLQAMEHAVELVFGQGRWGCLGKPISLLELNKVFVELLRRFDFTILDPTVPMKTWNYGVSMQSELNMKICVRCSDHN